MLALQQRRAPRQAFRWPVFLALVVGIDGDRPGRQRDPRLLRRGEDVDVGRPRSGSSSVRPNEAHESPRACRSCSIARCGSADNVRSSGPRRFRRRDHDLAARRRARRRLGLDHRVQRERRSRLALAPAAMAAVHEHRRARHPIADAAAGAATFQPRRCRCILDMHASHEERIEGIAGQREDDDPAQCRPRARHLAG